MDVTFSTFLGQLVSNPVLAVTVILALGAIFVNGWTDAPNAIATCVTTRCMPARAAILMSAAFNFLGVLIMTHFNASVANTISHIVDFGGNSTMALACLCAALFSIVVYGATASRFGIPTSQSHSLIAGLTGAAIALGGANSVNVAMLYTPFRYLSAPRIRLFIAALVSVFFSPPPTGDVPMSSLNTLRSRVLRP